MSDAIAALTGQKKILDAVERELQAGSGERHLLRGPSGTGKSWILDQLESWWADQGQRVVRVTGDSAHIRRELFPFTAAISRIHASLARERKLKDILSSTAGAVPIAGPTLERLLGHALSFSEEKQAEKSRFLSEDEREVLYNLQRLAKDEPLLLLVDNLQFFDERSLELLTLVTRADVTATYGFLKRMLIVAALADDAMVEAESALQLTLRRLSPREWLCERVRADHVGVVITAFAGGLDLPADVIAVCAAVSGGHLEVLRLLGDYLSRDSAGVSALLRSGKTDVPDLFLEALVEQRLRGLGSETAQMLRLMEILAVAGAMFTDAEMTCIVEQVNNRLADLVPRAIELDLLRKENGRKAFRHELLQRLFLRRVEKRSPEVHEKFAFCIGKLRPGDYGSRAFHLSAAGNTSDANLMQFLEYFQRVLGGEELLSESLDAVCDEALPDHAHYYRTLSQAWTAFRENRVRDARKRLEQLTDDVSPLLVAEKDFIYARAVKSFGPPEERALIMKILERWRDKPDSEFEQWFRLVSMLIVMQADGGDYLNARLSARILAERLGERARYDPFATSAKFIANRRYAAIYHAERAADRCRQAVEYFGQSAGGAVRNPLQLYFAQTNLAANLLMTGQFASASEEAAAALRLRDEYPQIHFPRPQIPLNNVIVAGFRAGSMTSAMAASWLERVIGVTADLTDLALLTNNLAVFHALSGDLGRAADDLSTVAAQLPPNGYYAYFVNANLISTSFLAGRLADADARFASLAAIIPIIPESDRLALVRRHEIMTRAFAEIRPGDVQAWWNYAINRHPHEVGPVWSFYGTGLLLSDIQFWSEA